MKLLQNELYQYFWLVFLVIKAEYKLDFTQSTFILSV